MPKDSQAELPQEEIDRRRALVREARHESRLEGGTPSEYGMALADALCHGYIDSDQRRKLLIAHFIGKNG
ncbi:MAG: hypothetical protein AAF982_06855 [Pseudomonadota bacterium]